MTELATQELARARAVELHERNWILSHGVSNLRSLPVLLRRQAGLRFAAVNSAADGAGIKTMRRGDWLMAWIYPSTSLGLWWVAVVEMGTSEMTTVPVATPAEVVVPLLERLGVAEARFAVEEAEPTECNPWDVPADRARPDARTVYFIRADGSGLIKIGVTGDVRGRLKSLQTGSPVPLALLAVIPGVGQAAEAALHERFAAARSHGEWFRPSPDLLAYIAEHAVPA